MCIVHCMYSMYREQCWPRECRISLSSSTVAGYLVPLPRVQYHAHNHRSAAGMPMPEIIRVGDDASRSGLGGAGRGIHMYCLMRQDPVG